MKKSLLTAKRVVSFLIVFSFLTSQVYAQAPVFTNDKLANSPISDPDINSARSDLVRGAVSRAANLGAIGEGQPLTELTEGRLPARILLTDAERTEIDRKLCQVIAAIILKNRENVPPRHRERLRQTINDLLRLHNNIGQSAYIFNADVRPNGHLAAFRYQGYRGFAIELIRQLTAEELAVLIFRQCIPENGIIAEREQHIPVYAEMLEGIFGKDAVATSEQKVNAFIAAQAAKQKTVPTLKMPGAPDMIAGTAEYEELVENIKAHFDRPLTNDELRRMRNIIQSKAPPAFFTDTEKQEVGTIVDALTGQISLHDLGIKLKTPLYKGKPLDSIVIGLVDLKGERSFKTNKGNFYQEVVVYDEATKTLFVYMPKSFFEDNFSKTSTTAVTQTVLHPLLETMLGLSHQEAALALSFYNSDDTIAKPGTITLSDAHRCILEDVKRRAINGDTAAINHLNRLLNPNFEFKLSSADMQALRARGRTLDSIDIIRIHSEELARIINGLIRGPVGRFETKVNVNDITRPELISGKMPTQDVLDEYSVVANATIAAALAVIADGYTGKVTDLTEKAEVKIIKDNTDGLAKDEIQVIFNLSGYRILVRVSEGGLRDEVERSFMGGEQAAGKKGMKVMSIVIDVVENTNAAARGTVGGSSFAISAKGEDALLGNAPDVYASLIAAHIPTEKIADFETEPLDPGPYTGEDNIDALRGNITKQLTRIADANGVKLNQMEVVLLNRVRESVRLAVLRELEQQQGLKVTVIEDGTFNQAVKAALGVTEGRLKVFFGTSGAPEAFANVILAKPFHREGALASMRVLSNAGLKKAQNVAPSNAYNFNGAEQNLMVTLRPEDARDILAGKKLFTTADVKGEVDGAITFITDNEVFGLPGIKLVRETGQSKYVVTTLRVSEKGNNAYAWVQQNEASISPVETKVGPHSKASTAPARFAEAQNVIELLNNIKGTVQVTRNSVIVTDRVKFVNETVDYLAFEAALSQNPYVKAGAQRILREVALSFNLKLASIHDLYMAKQAGKWSNMTVPAVNGRADLYHQFQQLFRAAKERNAGVLVLELARSEMRYAAMDANEFNAVSVAAAIKQGYEGLLFAQGDHYQVNKDKYKDESTREKELKAIEAIIRASVTAGKYNIDLDTSTLVDETVLDKILEFEKDFVSRYLAAHQELLAGLDENGVKSLHRKLVDEIEMGKIDFLSASEMEQIRKLYSDVHKTTAAVAMRFIRYIRGLEEKELGLTRPVSIGIEERHIDNPRHKDNPSTVLGSMTLMQDILTKTSVEGLVGPSKLSLQTGTMHGVGGTVDFGIYQRHLEYKEQIGVAVFVQHGASTLEKHEFDKMKDGDVGEVHLATEYQKIELDVVSRILPQLGDEMARHLLDMMKKDAKMEAKFRPMWELAFGNPKPAIAAIKADDTKREQKIALYNQLAAKQSATLSEKDGKAVIINQILGDTMPKGLKGTLKDLVKELPGPFKKQLMNLPANVRAAVDKALYEEFSIILDKLGASNTKAIVEEIIPFAKQPVIMPARPEALSEAVDSLSKAEAPEYQAITENLPVHAAILKYNLTRILSEHSNEPFFMGFETDIGGREQSTEMMPLRKVVDEVASMRDDKGQLLYPNLYTGRGTAAQLTAQVERLHLDKKLQMPLDHAFLGVRESSVKDRLYSGIAGSWLAAIDDKGAAEGDYMPVFEAITVTMMAYQNADISAIKNLYDAISNNPLTPEMLQDILVNKIVHILPKTTKLDHTQRQKLYELVHQVYLMA